MMKYYATLCVFAAVVLFFYMPSASSSNSNKTILVFGGTGNIGTEVVHHLLLHNYKPTLVSRGNWQYDSATLIKPHVTHISCERHEQRLSQCHKLMEFVGRQKHIDFVIDFSAFSGKVIKDAAEVLKGKVGLYIYISSDSIYEVCRKPQELPIKETESVRPEDKESRRKLAKRDGYGDGKLKAEEKLIEQRASGGFPYMSLRLPDVIGPRDTTFRWWILQVWIKYYHNIQRPILIDRNRKHFTSTLVFTKDIAKAILSAMEAGDVVHDQVYNIGFDEAFHYKHIVKSIAKELKIEGIQFKEGGADAQQIYPSVTKGPLDLSKIKQHLGFTATPWEHAVKETVAWYEKAHLQYHDELKRIINAFFENIVPEENQGAFLQAIKTSRTKVEL